MKIIFLAFLLFGIVYSAVIDESNSDEESKERTSVEDNDSNCPPIDNTTFYDQINEDDRADFLTLYTALALNKFGNLSQKLSIPCDLEIGYESYYELSLIPVPDDFEENLFNWLKTEFNLTDSDLKTLVTTPIQCPVEDDVSSSEINCNTTTTTTTTSTTSSTTESSTSPGGSNGTDDGVDDGLNPDGGLNPDDGLSPDDNLNPGGGLSPDDGYNNTDDNSNSTDTSNNSNSTNSDTNCITPDDIAILCCPFLQ